MYVCILLSFKSSVNKVQVVSYTCNVGWMKTACAIRTHAND